MTKHEIAAQLLLTREGFAWAERNAATSMTARIALIQPDDWPTAHIAAAIRACNEAAARQ